MEKFRGIALLFLLCFLPVLASAQPADSTFPLVKGKRLGLALTGNPGALHRTLIAFENLPGRAEEALVQKAGGSIKYTYHLVAAMAATIPEAAVEGLLRNPRVTRIEPDGVVHAIDAELENSWGVKRIGAGDVHVDGNRGSGVAVAILDSGMDCGHPDLAPNCAGGYDFVNLDDDPADDHYHGTHVSGTVAAVDDGDGVVGVSPAVSLYALKVLDASGSGYWSDTIAALQWAVDNGMQVTNNSYGSGINPGGTVQDAFANAEAAGLVSVAAAGNSGNCGARGNSVEWPARYASVIAVGATDQNDARPCFSSTGSDVELAAPGVSIYSTYPGGGYTWLSGTSMASPHVAGAAALVIAAGVIDSDGNGFINDEVRQILALTAEDLGDPGQDSFYGHGLVNAWAAHQAALATGTPEPAVNVSLSTDKTDYLNGSDTTALLTAVVTDEYGNPISGLDSTAFATTVDGVDAAVTFFESATTGTYEANLDLSGLADGTHMVAVTVTDARAISGIGSLQFSISPESTEATSVTVTSITYSTEGGKNGTKHLQIAVHLSDNLGNPVSGATVTIDVYFESTFLASGTGTTDTTGSVTFKHQNAPAGCYSTIVTNVSVDGLTWDGNKKEKGYCK